MALQSVITQVYDIIHNEVFPKLKSNSIFLYIFSDASLEDKAYPAFMVNRGLSYFLDTILLANEMNRRAGSIPGKMQYGPTIFRLVVVVHALVAMQYLTDASAWNHRLGTYLKFAWYCFREES